MKYYPILIPVKAHSSRCPGKNALLLPILYKSLKKSGIVERCVVLCDSEEIMCIADRIGFNTWLEPQNTLYKRDKYNHIELKSESVCKSEFESMAQWKLWYLSKTDEEQEKLYNGIIFNTSWCFLAPATQPIKHPYFYNTIHSHEDKLKTLQENNCKVIASTSLLTDRDIFHVCYSQSEGPFNDLVFSKDSAHRRGNLCYKRMNVDGTWYFINTNFLEDMVLGNDPDRQNELFWNKSNMYGINNNEQPHIDIDTEDDMKQLLFIIEQLK